MLFRSSANPHAGWKPTIEGPGPALSWDGTNTVEVNHLAGGMDTGIGASGRHGLNGSVGVEGRDRPLESFLNAGLAGLPLPTMKGGTVVLNAEGNPTQRTEAPLGSGIGSRQHIDGSRGDLVAQGQVRPAR